MREDSFGIGCGAWKRSDDIGLATYVLLQHGGLRGGEVTTGILSRMTGQYTAFEKLSVALHWQGVSCVR